MWTRISLGALALVALAAAAVLTVVTRPAAWRVERSATVAAPPGTVRAGLAEPQRWATWSPWADDARGAQWTFGGPTSGRGATAYWSTQESGWRLTVIDAEDDQVRVELEREGRSPYDYDLEFTLAAEGGGTRVVGTVRGEDDLLGRARALLWSHERVQGAELEAGLARLAAAAAAAPRAFRVERSALVSASPAAVRAVVTDLRGWRAWSPAAAGPPDAAWSFGGPEAGVGASAYWVSEGSKDRGRLTIVRADAGRVEVEQELEGTKPSACDHAITLAPEGGGTRVTWAAKGELAPGGPAGPAPRAEEALGPEVEASLAGLKRIVERPAGAEPGRPGPRAGAAAGRAR